MKPRSKIRLVKETDHSFIHDAWARTMRPRYPFTEGRLVRSAISAQVTKALSLGQLQSAVACDEEDDDVIYAFLIWHEVTKNIAAIDFAYTKNFCRRLGFQTSLLKALDPYSVKVLTFYAPCFSLKEYAKDGLQFGEALPKKGLVIDPFFYERLSPSDDMKGPL